jgi:hypothetical protein
VLRRQRARNRPLNLYRHRQVPACRWSGPSAQFIAMASSHLSPQLSFEPHLRATPIFAPRTGSCPTLESFGQTLGDQDRANIPAIYGQLATQPPMIASLRPPSSRLAHTGNALEVGCTFSKKLLQPISRFCGQRPLTRALRIQSRFWRIETNETKDLSVTPHRVAIDDLYVHCATNRLLLASVCAWA